jgi:hypothetical protein
MHDGVAADARCVLMWHVLIDGWCVILTYVENYIKWVLVCYLYIVREDLILIYTKHMVLCSNGINQYKSFYSS